MNPFYYQPLYLAAVLFLSLWVSVRRITSPDYTHQQKGTFWLFPFLISVVFAVWLGLRPVSSAFGDTVNYALEYRTKGIYDVRMDWSREWIWQWLMIACKSAGLSVNTFFLIVELIYVLSAFFAVKRFMPKDQMLGMLFVAGSLMFFTFGVNGIRNGMACHLVLLAISLLLDDKYFLGGLLCLIAFGIHRSTILPIAASLVAILGVRDYRYALGFWIASIFISLVAGSSVSEFFASLGFDDSVKRKIKDNWYNVICMTYCLCNAFWIMVIRSAYSNRFAYLSWFIYPIVIAYPLINLPVWEDQDRKTGWILLAYVVFTAFMLTIIW